MSKRGPAVVAELGRPETPQETADRKAESARTHRNSQSVKNLVGALIATLGVVAIIIFMVPRPPATVKEHVDYTTVASQAAGTEPAPLVAPSLPDGWHSNSAELRTQASDGVDTWYIGLITPDDQFAAVTQGFEANDSWIADQTKHTRATGSLTLDGVTWTVYDNRDSESDVGNVRYALTRTAGKSTFVLFGTAKNAEFRTLAKAVDREVQKGTHS